MREFEVYPCGDPFSKAWDVSERDGTGGLTYRGDISGTFRCRGLVAYLRKMYPGCKVYKRK